LDRTGSSDELKDNDDVNPETGTRRKIDEASGGSLNEDSASESDLKKVDTYFQQVSDEMRGDSVAAPLSEAAPVTEMSDRENHQATTDNAVSASNNVQRQRREIDEKIADSESRSDAIRAAQKQLAQLAELRSRPSAASATQS
jgi:hypothetical protein